jgi:hypothetical protein
VLRALEPLLISQWPDLVIEVLEVTAAALNRLDFLNAYRLLQLTPTGAVERTEFVPTEHRDYALIAR